MRRRNLIIIFSLIAVTIPQAVFANSSWHWISETRPWDILPWAAFATIVIEVLVIGKVSSIKQMGITALVVFGANLLSFLAPYGLLAYAGSWYGTFQHNLNTHPAYIVGVVFLLITLTIELPVVYLALKKYARDTHILIRSIIYSNAATTIMIAIIERIITEGSW